MSLQLEPRTSKRLPKFLGLSGHFLWSQSPGRAEDSVPELWATPDSITGGVDRGMQRLSDVPTFLLFFSPLSPNTSSVPVSTPNRNKPI